MNSGQYPMDGMPGWTGLAFAVMALSQPRVQYLPDYFYCSGLDAI